MSGECDKCTTLNHFTDALEALEGIDEVSFYVWKTQDKKVQKVMDTLSGEDFAERLETGIIGSRMKTHAYNIYWQYSELKHLKKTLGKKMSFYQLTFQGIMITSSFMRFRVPTLATNASQYLQLLAMFIKMWYVMARPNLIKNLV